MPRLKENKKQIAKILEKSFSKEDCVQCYFLKINEKLKGHQHKIVFKTRKRLSPDKIKKAQNALEIEFGKDSIEFVRWSDLIGSIIPLSKVYKIPFFDSRNIKELSPWRQCPIGYHWVKQHDRQKKNLEDVDPHCRRNPSNKDLLKSDEIDFISDYDLFKNPKVKASSHQLKFGDKGSQYDDLISGWTSYWNDVFKLKDPLHPNYVKALIASESSFNPKAKTYNDPQTGFARGLLQVTESSQRYMKDHNGKEIKDNYVEIEDEDIFDPNKNICAGIRWLFRKRLTAKNRLKRDPTWFEVLLEYKGRLKSKTEETKDVKNKLIEDIKKLNSSK
jgi:hypothetical protein